MISKLAFQFFCMFLLISCSTPSIKQPEIVKITQIEKRLRNTNDTTYIVNFWATWCLPCIKELPDFEKINKNYSSKKVKVILVSMDFSEDFETKLLPYIKKRGLQSEVVLLDEVNGNYFIPKISDTWTGAIPGTLIQNNKKRYKAFFERKVNYKFLEEKINFISKNNTE